MTRPFALALLLAAGGFGCQQVVEVLAPPPKTLKSANGQVEIKVPGRWLKDKLNDQADLQAADRPSELYVVVLSEPKAGLHDIDLAKFSELTRASQLTSMKGGTEEGRKERKVNGLPALEYVLKGKVDGVDVVMKHVSVEGTAEYHQVLVWTLKSKWASEQAGLDAVIDSFKESAAK